jgi:hypothetical protein
MGFLQSDPHLLSQLRHAKAPWLHGRCPASTLLRTSPTPPPPARALWISTHALSRLARDRRQGPLQFLVVPSARAVSSHPGESNPLHLVEGCGLMLASPLLEGWPLSATFNEAESSSRITTARAFASSGSDWQDCSRPSRVRLHGSRPFTMTNTFSSLEPPSLLGAPEGNERNKGCN